MTKDDIIRMAQEAGVEPTRYMDEDAMKAVADYGTVERFANLVAAHEREECAQIADKFHVPMSDSVADLIASQIRARGNNDQPI